MSYHVVLSFISSKANKIKPDKNVCIFHFELFFQYLIVEQKPK